MPPYDSTVRLPPDLGNRLASELAPDERVVWFGQPRADLVMRSAFFLVPFGIFFTGFALMWMVIAIFVTAGLMAPCGLPFIAVGIYMIASPVWLRSKANRTIYALTDRRAIVWRPGWFGRFSVQSFTAAGLGQMSRVERPDGAGDLVFQVYTTGSGEDSRTYRSGFLGVDNVRNVEDLVRSTLQASA